MPPTWCSRSPNSPPALRGLAAGLMLALAEVAAAAAPATAPVPRRLWTYDDGDWVLLVFEDVAGTPPAEPWRDDELARVLAAMAEVAALLTPSPIRKRTGAILVAVPLAVVAVTGTENT